MNADEKGYSAFPTTDENFKFPYGRPGMYLRDWFAGQIAAGMAAYSGTSGVSYGPTEIAGRSCEIADAMLAERSKS